MAERGKPTDRPAQAHQYMVGEHGPELVILKAPGLLFRPDDDDEE